MKPAALACLFFLIATSACGKSGLGSPPGTPIPTANYHAIATYMAVSRMSTQQSAGPAATQTSQARTDLLAQARQWPVSLSETFDDNALNWPTGSETGDLTDISWDVSNGQYRWQATTHDSFVYWTHPDMEWVTDFYLSAVVQQQEGPASGEVGVIFRLTSSDTSEGYYSFRLEDQGRFIFDLYSFGQWYTLIDLLENPAIHPGMPNQIEVIAQGENFLFYINGVHVAQYRDDSLASGYAGAVIALYDPGDQAKFNFDSFELRVPEE